MMPTDQPQNAALPAKEIVCDCGNRIVSQQRSNWCRKCGRQVFYDPKDKRRSRYNNIFLTLMIVTIIGFLTYVYIEMILTPVLTNFQ